MNGFPDSITITNAIMFSDRINSDVPETLTFMARLLRSEVSVIVRMTTEQMQVALLPVYSRYQFDVLKRPSILRIKVTGNIRKSRVSDSIEQSAVFPLFTIIATEFHIVDVVYTAPEAIPVKDIVINKEKEDGNNNNTKDTDYQVNTSEPKRSKRDTLGPSNKRHEPSKSPRRNPPRRGRSSTPFHE